MSEANSSNNDVKSKRRQYYRRPRRKENTGPSTSDSNATPLMTTGPTPNDNVVPQRNTNPEKFKQRRKPKPKPREPRNVPSEPGATPLMNVPPPPLMGAYPPNFYHGPGFQAQQGFYPQERYYQTDFYQDQTGFYQQPDFYQQPPRDEIPNNGAQDGPTKENSKPKKKAKPKPKSKPKPSELSLRERLTHQLITGQAECLVCLESIKPKHATWHCDSECYQVFHIHCIKKWSKTARTEDQGGWRCPGCQFVRKATPRDYRCFCGKVLDPVYDRRDTPHSCGETCGKPLKTSDGEKCPHKCVELCHPGPCPPCTASIRQTCPCGRTSQHGRCGTTPICENICDRLLNCKSHRCKQRCHVGNCDPCKIQIQQKCGCQNPTEKTADCDVGVETYFSCGNPCGKQLKCGNHVCGKTCHAPNEDCQSCERSPEIVKTCPCGKKMLEIDARKTCTDPIPSCGQVCEKSMICGHSCQNSCHEGECQKCPLSTKVRCRCGFMDKEMECAKLDSRADDARCDKQCSKKRDCLRHKCGQKCCILFEHVCPLICGRLLSCGLHRCNEPCHRGRCSSCPNVSFNELSCHCGSKIIYPPIPCGVKPPPCDNVCTRAHACNHLVMHNCHSEEKCPPCTALTEKYCYGKHELRKSVVCHIDGISCGRPCGKQLSCGRHSCIKPCHPGDCVDVCSQPCKELRATCGHICNNPCHDGPCPLTACAEKVKLNCACGNLTAMVICSANSGMHSGLLAAQISDLNNGNSTSSITLKDLNKKSNKLECNAECAKLERNRRLALALQIENPDVATKLSAPKYSDFLKEFARKDPTFAQSVHDKLTDLVKLAKESKQKSRMYSFEYMNRDKRTFVHELSDHFGVESESYDAEPKRNVVATAVKDRVWLPSQSVLEVVQGIRKVAPVAVNPSSRPTFTTLQPIAKSNSTEESGYIDYFDF